MKGFTPILDSTGKITGYKTEVGADTVFPFSSNELKVYELSAFSVYNDNSMYPNNNATGNGLFDISIIPNYDELVLFETMFPIIMSWSSGGVGSGGNSLRYDMTSASTLRISCYTNLCASTIKLIVLQQKKPTVKPYTVPAIPKLTSNNGQNGHAVISANFGKNGVETSADTSNDAYLAFDQNTNTGLWYKAENQLNGEVSYVFNSPIKINTIKAKLCNHSSVKFNVLLQYMIDDSWITASAFTVVNTTPTDYETSFLPVYAKAIRLIVPSPTKTSGHNVYVYELQCYKES